MKEPNFNVDAVRARMASIGVTVDQIAEATGKSRSAAYKWVAALPHERNKPKLREAGIIAQLLRWPLGACVGLEAPRSMRYSSH